MKRLITFLSLFTSASTLLCCALPALFVALGMGAAFAGLIGTLPELVWVSENKGLVFGVGGFLLVIGGLLQVAARKATCPIDAAQGDACQNAKDWSKPIYFSSVALYAVGFFFAFLAPRIF
jgi:hypothetical protein